VDLCETANIPFRTLPGINDLTAGRISVKALREVSIDDLLGRDQVNLNWKKISEGISNKTILISGGGGSIGAEISRQVAQLGPEKLVIVDNNELNLYEIEMQLKQGYKNLKFTCALVDITDVDGITHVMSQHKPDVVFHAAAYKHVPMLESQVRVAIKNNLHGTQIMAEAADKFKVKQFILISTDKVVNPTNVMGASKRIAEIFCQNFNRFSTTNFITVRFGNVLGSTGSVVPLFQKQLEQGGPLTVTHSEVTRYFMTLSEASQLILQACVMGEGGEIFVLDMGEPIKIRYLAEQMIRLSGNTAGEDIDIVYTGLRPGEKLKEELFYENERLSSTSHQKILRAYFREIDWQQLLIKLQEINQACKNCNDTRLSALLRQMVPEYDNNKTVELELVS